MSVASHLNLRLLQLLAAIGETGNLTQAAARLCIVPSAASRRIRAAELALGVTLIERSSRGVALTPAGEAVARHATQMQRGLVRLSKELQEHARGVRGRVSLSAAASAIAQHLPEDLGRFMLHHPDIGVDLQEHFSSTIVQRLRQRQTDVGILVPPDELELPGLTLRPYRRERLVVVLPAQHELAGAKELRFADIAGEAWVGLPQNSSLAQTLRKQAAMLGLELQARISVYGMESVCRMVEHGLGIAILPAKALEPATRFPGLAVVPLQEAWAARTLFIAVSAESDLDPAAQALVDALAPDEGSLLHNDNV